MRTLTLLAAVLLVSPLAAAEKGARPVSPILNVKMKSLAGQEIDLAQYQGKVVLIVNVASECGYTPQYKALQALHDRFARDGLVVLGVPSNEFGTQEPGTNDQIARFCQTNYGVKFPMLAKVAITGKDQVPLYRHLTSKETNPRFAGPVTWNFTKFLLGRDGTVVARFEPDAEPESEEVVKAIKAALDRK